MRTYSQILVLTFVALGCCHAVFPTRAGQPQAASAKSDAPFSPRDLSGVWFISEYHQNILPNEDPPFQPWASALYKKRDYEKEHSEPDHGPDPVPRCIPPGVPRAMLQPLPWEIIMARDRVVMIFEFQSLVREIFTDGRGHPKDLDPTYMGNSIGHWDKDTFVVDTVGFNGKTWIDPKGLPTTDALHVTERIRRVSSDTLSDDYTIDDRKAYTKTWTVQKLFTRHPDWQIKEYVCAENNLTH